MSCGASDGTRATFAADGRHWVLLRHLKKQFKWVQFINHLPRGQKGRIHVTDAKRPRHQSSKRGLTDAEWGRWILSFLPCDVSLTTDVRSRDRWAQLTESKWPRRAKEQWQYWGQYRGLNTCAYTVYTQSILTNDYVGDKVCQETTFLCPLRLSCSMRVSLVFRESSLVTKCLLDSYLTSPSNKYLLVSGEQSCQASISTSSSYSSPSCDDAEGSEQNVNVSSI